jgi:hypothetical protein
VPLLSNLARVRQERKERWRGEVRSGVCWWWKKRCLPEESQSVLSQPRVISNAFFPVASKACPTCGMQHAQSDLRSTCFANQPLLHAVHACKRRPSAEGYDLLFLVLFSESVDRYLWSSSC